MAVDVDVGVLDVAVDVDVGVLDVAVDVDVDVDVDGIGLGALGVEGIDFNLRILE